VWYGGGKLAADLSWPKLRQRWTQPRTAPGAAQLTAEERNAIWDHATRVAADAAAQICTLAWTDPPAAADAAWATSDTLHVAAAMLGSRILRQAADAYDRAARSPYGRIPPLTPAGNRLRQAARLLSAFAYLTGDRSLTPVVLITKLAALAEAVAELRESQQHAARPPQPAPPPNACTPPPARLRSCARRRLSAVLPGLPRCLSRRPRPAVSHPHRASPASFRAGRRQHVGRDRHSHAAPLASPDSDDGGHLETRTCPSRPPSVGFGRTAADVVAKYRVAAGQ
jgi:hypothetical protein